MVATLAVLEITLLSLGISGMVLLWVRPLPSDGTAVVIHLGQALILAVTYVVSFYYNDLYDLRRVRRPGQFGLRLPQSLGTAFILLAVLYLLFPQLRLPNGALLLSLLSLFAVALLVRGSFYTIVKARSSSERVLILGTSPLARKIASEIEAAPHLGYSVIGFVDHGNDGEPIPAAAPLHPPDSILGPLDSLDKLIADSKPDRIFVALTERRRRLPVWDLLKLRTSGLMVEDGIQVYERLTGKLAIESLVPSYLLFSPDFEKSLWQQTLRRTISLVVSAVGLIVTAPLFPIIALAIKLDSRGPVFFRQARAGKGGRLFRLVKFRTMRPGNGNNGSVWARDDTHRITRVGKWLRKLRLDELPQFINILKGDMDLVGPRPEMADNIAEMTAKIPYYGLRHVIRPGVTGWAQINNGYSVCREDVTEKIRYDLYYVKHMSPWFDLRILVDTVKTVIFGRGAR